ncbi:hypothetical protein SAMN04489738_0001, partial [Pseudarthrobacter chlorophenolicus]
SQQRAPYSSGPTASSPGVPSLMLMPPTSPSVQFSSTCWATQARPRIRTPRTSPNPSPHRAPKSNPISSINKGATPWPILKARTMSPCPSEVPRKTLIFTSRPWA